jgi:hypothetical protein
VLPSHDPGMSKPKNSPTHSARNGPAARTNAGLIARRRDHLRARWRIGSCGVARGPQRWPGGMRRNSHERHPGAAV